VAVHPDSASLELHLEIGRTEFRRLADMVTLRQIEVYGSLSDKAIALLEQKATMLGGKGLTVTRASRDLIILRLRQLAKATPRSVATSNRNRRAGLMRIDAPRTA
jgi:hypothetical protein